MHSLPPRSLPSQKPRPSRRATPNFRQGSSRRSKKTEESPEGPVRKLVIEFKQGDITTVDKQIEELLTGKGYRRYKSLQQGEGLVGDYGNQGRRVTVTTNPANGQLALDADSLGTVYFVWKE